MTTLTITIADGDDSTISLEGKLDRPEAIDEPPTPALIIGTYISANVEQVCKDAVAWFNDQARLEQSAQNSETAQ